jgi:hypothetical protein
MYDANFMILQIISAILYLWISNPKFKFNATTFTPFVFLMLYNNFFTVFFLGVLTQLRAWLTPQTTKTKVSLTLRTTLTETVVVLAIGLIAWLAPFAIDVYFFNASNIGFELLSIIFLLLATAYTHTKGVNSLFAKSLSAIFLLNFTIACRDIFPESLPNLLASSLGLHAILVTLSFIFKPIRYFLTNPTISSFLKLNLLMSAPPVGGLILIMWALINRRRESKNHAQTKHKPLTNSLEVQGNLDHSLEDSEQTSDNDVEQKNILRNNLSIQVKRSV